MRHRLTERSLEVLLGFPGTSLRFVPGSSLRAALVSRALGRPPCGRPLRVRVSCLLLRRLRALFCVWADQSQERLRRARLREHWGDMVGLRFGLFLGSGVAGAGWGVLLACPRR